MAATAPTATPAVDAMVSLIQTTIGTILGPLVGQLDAQRQTIVQQADQLVSMAETIGTLRAENRALLARTAAQLAEPTPGEPSPARWRRWAWAAVLIAAIVAVVVVLLFVLPLLDGAP